MTKRHLLVPMCALSMASGAESAKPTATSMKPIPASTTPGAVAAEAPYDARIVQYGERDVVRVRAKLRYTTLIVLPKSEQILDFTCGDKEFWVVNGTQNFAYIKPAKAGSGTNVNLITASGNVYSFALTEVSEQQDARPDLKVFVEPRDESMAAALNGTPRFFPAAQVEDWRQQVEMARTEAREAKQQAQAALERETARMRSEYPNSLRFPYRFERGRRPFEVTGMWHDGKFTYIQANAQETPALYEIKDGKPNLIQFDFKNGTYTVAKVLESGYLAVGKQKLNFIRQE
jgi:type IV secretory pathway VirB9-like protein